MPGLKNAIYPLHPNSNTQHDKPGLYARGGKRPTYKNINVHFHSVSQVHTLTRKEIEEKFRAAAQDS